MVEAATAVVGEVPGVRVPGAAAVAPPWIFLSVSRAHPVIIVVEDAVEAILVTAEAVEEGTLAIVEVVAEEILVTVDAGDVGEGEAVVVVVALIKVHESIRTFFQYSPLDQVDYPQLMWTLLLINDQPRRRGRCSKPPSGKDRKRRGHCLGG